MSSKRLFSIDFGIEYGYFLSVSGDNLVYSRIFKNHEYYDKKRYFSIFCLNNVIAEEIELFVNLEAQLEKIWQHVEFFAQNYRH